MEWVSGPGATEGTARRFPTRTRSVSMPVEDLEGLFRQARVAPVPGFDGEAHPRPGATSSSHYDGRAERLWADVTTGAELLQRVRALPGFGDAKARIFVGSLGKRLGVRPPGWDTAAADWPSIADADSFERVPRSGNGSPARGCEAGWWRPRSRGEDGDDAPTSRPATTQSMRMPAEMKVPKPRS